MGIDHFHAAKIGLPCQLSIFKPMFTFPTSIEIPLRFSGSQHLLGDFELNGHPAVFLVDTGASNSCMEAQLAASFGLRPAGEPLPMTGAGNEKLQATASTKSELCYCQQLLARMEFMLIDMQSINSAFEEQGEARIDGILGADLLQPRAAVINYKKKLLRLEL